MTTPARRGRALPGLDGLGVVILSPQPWEGGWQSKQAVADSLAQLGARVLYVNPSWRPYRSWKGPALERAAENLWVLRAGSLPLRRWRLVRRWNMRWTLRAVRKAIRKLDMADAVIWCFDPVVAPLVRGLDRSCVVYHLVDEIPPELRGPELDLLALADAVLVTTEPMADRLRARHGDVTVVDHGCDFQDVRQAALQGSEPPDLGAIPRPRAGYIGTLNARLDAGLLDGLLQRNPGVSFVLVGPAVQEDVHDEAALSRRMQELLARYSNLHALGFRPREELPAYAVSMDVLLMPYDVSLWWVRTCSPLKLYLYFATGLPVVSTRFPFMDRFADQLDLADDLETFQAALERALAGRGQGRASSRIALAEDRDWNRLVLGTWERIRATREGQGCWTNS